MIGKYVIQPEVETASQQTDLSDRSDPRVGGPNTACNGTGQLGIQIRLGTVPHLSDAKIAS